MDENLICKNRLLEIAEIKDLNVYDVEKLFKSAVHKKFKKDLNIYLGDDLKIDFNLSLTENLTLNKERILKEFGSLEEFKKNKDFSYLNSYVYLRDFEGSEYRKAEKTILKDNKIIGFKCYNLYSGLYSIVDRIYNFFYLVVEDKDLMDYTEINKYIEDNNLKEVLYNGYGEVKIKDFKFKLFKNGRLDITFKSDDVAIRFFNEFKRLQDRKYKIKNFKF